MKQSADAVVQLIDPCYIAREWCGCIRAIIADEPERAKEVSKFVAKMIRSGLSIERIEAEAFRNGSAGKFLCECEGPRSSRLRASTERPR